MVNVERLILSAGFNYNLTTNDATVAAGQTLLVNASALGASNTFTFNGAAETNGSFNITGGAGNDTITGGASADAIHIETGGNDIVSAGGGNDLIYTGAALTAADKIDGGAGTDIAYLTGNYTGASALVFNATTMVNVERLILCGRFQLQSHHQRCDGGGRPDAVGGCLRTGGGQHADLQWRGRDQRSLHHHRRRRQRHDHRRSVRRCDPYRTRRQRHGECRRRQRSDLCRRRPDRGGSYRRRRRHRHRLSDR